MYSYGDAVDCRRRGLVSPFNAKTGSHMDNDIVALVRSLRVAKPRRHDAAPDITDEWNAMRADDLAALPRASTSSSTSSTSLHPSSNTPSTSLQEAAWTALVSDERHHVETVRRRLRGPS